MIYQLVGIFDEYYLYDNFIEILAILDNILLSYFDNNTSLLRINMSISKFDFIENLKENIKNYIIPKIKKASCEDENEK